MVPFIMAFALWAALHSVTAGLSFKAMARRVMGERAYAGLYRLVYNVFALATLVPVLYVGATAIPARQLWAVPRPLPIAFLLVQGVGAVGVVVSILEMDLWHFAGARQVAGYVAKRRVEQPAEPPRLSTGGLHGLVRHPLYFFSLLFLWFAPVMTLDLLGFNVGATLYFWIGSIYEERKLVKQFGEAYQKYQRRVPRLLPLPRP